jgi:hypothetical protein
MKVTFTPVYFGTFAPGAILEINSKPKNLYGRFRSLHQGLSALEKFLDNPSNAYGPDTGLSENTLFLFLGLRGATTGTSVSIEIEKVSGNFFSFSVAEELPTEVFGIPRAGTSLTLKELITTLEERISPQ